jgi:hypothetical protein
MKIGFLGDLFVEKVQGGGELNDAVLIEFLSRKHHLTEYQCSQINFDSLQQENLYIVSNFVTLPTSIRDWLINKKYLIYEHDHKYTRIRDVSKFKDFKIPPGQLTHQEFYKKAHKVVVLSNICKTILEKNNISDNVHNIGCSLWHDEDLDIISQLSKNQKKYKFGVVDNKNPIKGLDKTLKYCQHKNIQPHLIKSSPNQFSPSVNHHDFLASLSECENLIFFPQVLETFSRLAAEANMLNCNLVTTPNMLGFASEDYSCLKGIELIEKIRDQKNKALNMFDEWCSEK